MKEKIGVVNSALMRLFLRHGCPITMKQLKEATGLPHKTIKEALEGAGSIADFVTAQIPVIERNYNSLRCYRTISAYSPSKKALRAEILALSQDPDLAAMDREENGE